MDDEPYPPDVEVEPTTKKPIAEPNGGQGACPAVKVYKQSPMVNSKNISPPEKPSDSLNLAEVHHENLRPKHFL